ncbi:hypothetical protein AaE_008174 [Aphanomyces astaci]|uniref:Reverse transcriptase Ty1/copia-type domain-containing protein n=1 Tax=Aphanomyces astaci TaxID=112090 RepID=A0A6A4ZVI8_APHAT|nr:hypothetical protein AaE_008174 [Aphanomyces astaci]
MRVSGENLEVVCTYVDDFLVMAKTATMANKILDELKTKMKLERQGDAAYFLGEQSKHIDVRHYYARQPMGIGTIEVRHVGTADQLADVLTKVSTKDAIMKCKNAAMDVSPVATNSVEHAQLFPNLSGQAHPNNYPDDAQHHLEWRRAARAAFVPSSFRRGSPKQPQSVPRAEVQATQTPEVHEPRLHLARRPPNVNSIHQYPCHPPLPGALSMTLDLQLPNGHTRYPPTKHADTPTDPSQLEAHAYFKHPCLTGKAAFQAPTAYETSILDTIIAGSLTLDQPPNFLRQLLPPDEIALFHDQMRVHFGYLQVSINVSIKISADMASPALDRQFFPTYLKQDAISEAECDNLRRDMNSCHLHPVGHKLIVVFNSKPREPSGATASFHFAN